MPLIRRLPKRGFNNAAFHKNYAIVNLDDLNEFKAGTVVSEQLLRESNLIRGHFAGIKILGGGELKHGLTVEADKVSVAAREKIEKAGGTIVPRPRDERRVESESASVVNLTSNEPRQKPSASKPSKAKAAKPKPQAKKTSRKS